MADICKCHKEKYKPPIKYNDSYIGKIYGRYTIIGYDEKRYFVCQCECGTIKSVVPKNLTSGAVKSCGCFAKEISEKSIASSPLYSTWSGMKSRCYNENSSSYADYGGRGINICDEWLNDFKIFESWAIENGYRPNCGLTLDRISVNKGYSPDNCRYASVFVQCVNQRPRKKKYKNSKLYEINEISKSKKDWCIEFGIWEATVNYRMGKMKMSLEQALTAEKVHEGNHHPTVRQKKDLEVLNSINSYIECNLYMKFISTTDKYELIPQYKINSYNVDFLVKDTNYVIECDGHDYHKTKEQISSDYKRERETISLGYIVLRFSGSEINGDPEYCVNEILKILDKNKLESRLAK